MKDHELENALRRSLGRGSAPRRLEETVRLCRDLTGARAGRLPEVRLGFWDFLSGIFRFEGVPILLSRAAALLAVALSICSPAGDLRHIPAYIPLFVLTALPVLFRGQYRGTSELEAVTRASGAQILLARLILAGGSDIVCMTLLLGLELRLAGSVQALGRLVLYHLVPYLLCVTVTLYLIRRKRSDGLPLGAAAALAACAFWRASSRLFPRLYELSAVGVWIAAFLVFTAFFVRELYFIIQADKEGRIYGAVH